VHSGKQERSVRKGAHNSTDRDISIKSIFSQLLPFHKFLVLSLTFPQLLGHGQIAHDVFLTDLPQVSPRNVLKQRNQDEIFARSSRNDFDRQFGRDGGDFGSFSVVFIGEFKKRGMSSLGTPLFFNQVINGDFSA